MKNCAIYAKINSICFLTIFFSNQILKTEKNFLKTNTIYFLPIYHNIFLKVKSLNEYSLFKRLILVLCIVYSKYFHYTCTQSLPVCIEFEFDTVCSKNFQPTHTVLGTQSLSPSVPNSNSIPCTDRIFNLATQSLSRCVPNSNSILCTDRIFRQQSPLKKLDD